MFSSKDIFQTASTGGYKISRSVRLRSSASAYFNRTFGSPTDNKKFTISFWMKRGKLGAQQSVFGAYSAGTDYTALYFDANDKLNFTGDKSNANLFGLTTAAVYRDPSAWYHVVAVFDSANGTAANRCIIYINNVSQTLTGTTVPSGAASYLNANAVAAGLGMVNSAYTDGYLTEINFIDGQALTPSSFGQYNATTGVWQPKKYGGTYGTNGFYLNFSDNSAATAAAIGKDYSGNGNNWTPNNISVTAGVTYDSMLDVPTMYADGGNGRGNYPVVNPLDKDPSVTVSEGNLAHTTGASWLCSRGSFQLPTSGKWYWETTIGTTTSSTVGASIGVCTAAAVLNNFNTTGQYQAQAAATGNLYSNGTQTASTLGVFTAGDIIQVAADCDNGKIWIGKNNVFWNSTGGTTGNPSSNTNETFTTSPAGMFPFTATYQDTVRYNFGQRPFSYTPPTGFKALNTQNLPSSTITNGATQFAASTWAGTGSAQSINNGTNNSTGVTFQPDFVWGKIRSGADLHILSNFISGPIKYLSSNTTTAEATNAQTITSFNSNGFSIGTSTDLNRSGYTFVGWQWKASGATVSNTAGSITSTVDANTTAGFSIVNCNTSSSVSTIGHGLGVAPAMIIGINTAAPNGWWVYHKNMTSSSYYMALNTTAAQTLNTSVWTATPPTSTVFTQGSGSWNNAANAIFYCWAEVAGYSKAFTYVGNSSSDGAFVYLGFRARYILHKASSTTSQWMIWDTSRNTYNVLTNAELLANSSAAEGSGGWGTEIDIVSNGIKFRGSDNANFNQSGVTYIGFAFAENPFKNALAR